MPPDKKRSILFIAHDVMQGGAELCLFEIIRDIDRTRFVPYVVAPRRGPFVDALEALGQEVFICPLMQWVPYSSQWGATQLRGLLLRAPQRVSKLIDIIRLKEIDIVYSNTVTIIDGAIAALCQRKKHVWHLHEAVNGNADIKSYLPQSLLFCIIGILSDKVLLSSHNLLSRHGATRLNDDKYSVVHNGIDINKFAATTSWMLHDELKLPYHTKLVGQIGTISPSKGYADFIQAAALTLAHYSDVAFVIVGGGDKIYQSELERLAGDLGISEKVYFLGTRTNIPEIMGSIDLLVSASIQESFGRVIVEAMAAGKPVISTRSGGPEEIIVDGVTGILVPVSDVTRLSDAMVLLLENERLMQQYGKAGRERVERHFSIQQYIRGVESAIEQAILG